MVKIHARIKLYKGDKKRQTPFHSGYRPLFKFIEGTKTSGQINIIGRNQIKPGEEELVEITFLNEDFLGDEFKVGKQFNFYEVNEPLGEGEIVEIKYID